MTTPSCHPEALEGRQVTNPSCFENTSMTSHHMKYYYVYILECSDRSYYTGITNDLDNRQNQHNSGLNNKCYTYDKRPVKMVYSEEFTDVREAISREKQIKRWTRAKKQALINKEFESLPRLSKRRTPSSLNGGK